MSKVEGLVVVIEVDTVEPAVPVVAGKFSGVVFEHRDNPPVFAVPVEVWIRRVGNVESDAIPRLEGRHNRVVTPRRPKPYRYRRNSSRGGLEYEEDVLKDHRVNSLQSSPSRIPVSSSPLRYCSPLSVRT